MNNVTIANTVIADQIADGINFHQGVTNSKVVNSLIRNTADDALAMWSQTVGGQPAIENANNVFDHNTVQSPVLANGIAIYGGRDNTVSNNVVADPVREGSGLHAGQRFGSTPSPATSGSRTTRRCGPVRSSSTEDRPRCDRLYALEGSLTANVEVTGDNFLQSTYNAILIVSDFPVKDLYGISNVHFKDNPRRRHRYVGRERPRCRIGDLPERRCAQRRCRWSEQLRLVSTSTARDRSSR